MSIRHPHKELGVAIIKDGIGPIFTNLSIKLADGLTITVDIDTCPSRFGKEIFNPLI